MADYILVMKNITKEFPGVKALDDVNLEVERGEILFRIVVVDAEQADDEGGGAFRDIIFLSDFGSVPIFYDPLGERVTAGEFFGKEIVGFFQKL